MAAVNLIGSYNYALVALSVLIAIFASYAALDLAGRVTASSGWTRVVWLLGGAGAMGTGIWSMHYIGMLAFILPIPVAYHWPTVLLSLFAAILASVVALRVVSRQKMSRFRALAGSVLMGTGIASMHYIGMAAMRLPAVCQFNSFLVVLSVVFAILISLAALWITFHFRDEKTGTGWEKLAGSVVMGTAIPVMHYTGMAAASFTPSSMPVDLTHAVSISSLGTAGIVSVTFVVLGLALLTSWVDRQYATHTLEVQEQKLQQSEAYLSEAQRLSHTGSFGWRVSTGEITWSEETFRIFGYEPAPRATVEMVMERTHPEDRSTVQQIFERASSAGQPFDFEHRLLMPEGSVKQLRVMGHPARDESGRFEFVGAVTDITDRKRGESLLRESEQRFRAIFNEAGVGITLLDLTPGQPIENNRALQTMLGCSREELSSFGTYNELTIPESREADAIAFSELCNGSRDTLRQEKHFIRRDGRSVWANVIFTLLRDPEGRPRYIISIHEDITERKQAEEALRQAQADLAHVNRVTTMGELTASLAHEVNQPIAAAVTNANTCLRWLTRDHPDLEEARAATMRIVKDGTRAAEIISRIRLLFKKGTSEREFVDVNEVIREMIVLLRSEATRYSVSFRTELAADLPQVMGDRVQLQQVFMNLMLNGVDAMKDLNAGGELTIKSRQSENGELLISVSDTGVGLPQQADQIFNAFFTTKVQGIGMGLSISRSIVESHGGRLWAADNSPRGASFHVALPTNVEGRE